MGRFLQSLCSLENSIAKYFGRLNSLKSFHLRHFTLMLLFCFGADADYDFFDKSYASGKVNHDVHGFSLPTSPTDYFSSYKDGDWSLASTWQSSPDNINWQPATDVPTKTANKIWIQSGHVVFASNTVSLDELTVGGILELRSGGVLNINDGLGDDVTILENGILQIISTDNYVASVQQPVGAVINIATAGKIILGNGILSIGTGYEGFATSTDNIWNDGAVFEYNNNGVFAIADLTYFPNATASDIPIFRVTRVLGTPTTGAAYHDFLVNGRLDVNGNVTISGSSKKTFRDGIKGNATITQSGTGKFYLTAPGALLDGATLILVLSQPIDLSPSTLIPVNANVSISGSNMGNAGKILNINGTLDIGTSTITNSSGGLVILNGLYRTAHPGGFSGGSSSIPATTGNIILNPGSTIELYASGNQSINARSDFKNIILSGNGIKTPVGSFNPAGTVTIKDDAIFDCSGRNIGDESFGLPTSTNLTMSGNSRLIVDTYDPNPKMGGVYNLTGGVVEFKCTNATPQTIRSKNYQNIEITGTNVLMSTGNITLNDMGTFTVKSGGIFTINDNTIDGPIGTQTVTVESGGVFKCGTNKGFHGFTITPVPIKSSAINSDVENIILQPNSTVEYSRSSPPLADGDQPITNTNGLIYQNLILSGTGNKTAPPDDLIIQENLTKTGSCTFIHNNGTVIFNGSNAQAYNASSPEIVFNNLTNENLMALNVNSELSVYKKLEFADNSKTNFNADITLNSGKNGTANVAIIASNATLNYNTGFVVTERYINSGNLPGSHGKSWQFLSSPVFGETIYNTWQESGDNAITNYGTWITDPLGTINGFDAISISSSIKKFNATNQTWEGVGNTNIPVADPYGYFLYIRGDRTVRNAATAPTSTILRTRGKLLRGDQPPINVVANSYQSVGNPYASAVDFSKLITSNVDNSFYVWDPSIAGNYNVGGYQTISAVTGFIAVPGASSIYASNTDYRNVQSGQAFMVHNASAVNGSIQFTEDCKMTDGHHLVNREGAIRQMLFASLYNKDGLLADGNAIVFDKDFSNNPDQDDALKLPNSGENFGVRRNDKILAIEARQPVSRPDTVFYDLHNLKQQAYRLVFVPKNLSPDLSALLTDQFLKTETKISLTDTTFLNFSVTSDPASYASNRFMVIFLPFSAAPLTVSFISITAQMRDKNVLVEWKVENEKYVHHYEIEHSVDGVHFLLSEEINSLKLIETSRSYTHENPANGNNFYRVRCIDKNGKSLISPVVKVFLESFKSGIIIYPNPVKGENINLMFRAQTKGNYRLNVYDASGEIVRKKTIRHSGASENHTFKMNKNFSHGIFYLEILKPDGTKVFLEVMK